MHAATTVMMSAFLGRFELSFAICATMNVNVTVNVPCLTKTPSCLTTFPEHFGLNVLNSRILEGPWELVRLSLCGLWHVLGVA